MSSIKEKISVKNFLSIKEADLPIKKMNILIGEQTQGKSVLMKLAFMFHHVLSDFIFGISFSDSNYSDFIKNIKHIFSRMFQTSVWRDEGFKIHYEFGNLSISITHDKDEEFINVNSSGIKSFLDSLISEKESFLKEIKADTVKKQFPILVEAYKHLIEFVSKKTEYEEYSNFIIYPQENFYIPFNRSLTSIINTQSFAIRNLDKEVDFGFFLERYIGQIQTLMSKEKTETPKKELADYINSEGKKLLHGIYRIDNNKKVYILDENLGEIAVTNSSSSQQDLWSLLMILHSICTNDFSSSYLYIEEPELNLYPKTQVGLTHLLTKCLQGNCSKVFITTHSPYVLNTISNSIFASNKSVENPSFENEVNNIVSKDLQLSSDDVSAYHISDGFIKDITTPEGINAEKFDESADRTLSIFSDLVEVGFQND